MEILKGLIKEVYIPDKDVMNSNKIGFKVEVTNKIICIEEEQNHYNVNILKGDKVVIVKQEINNIEFVDIKKLVGDKYE